MVEGSLFKTKLCLQFKRGRCVRYNCSFAHGESELRRLPGSFHGKRDFGNGDLRDKLERRHSPRRSYSPMRDARGRDLARAAEHGVSRSPERERRYRKSRRLEGQSDISGSLRTSDVVEHKVEEAKISAKLKQLQLDINVLDHQKSELQTKLEGRAQEVETLTSKIQELEAQLHKEKEDNQKTLSRIKKFVKEHKRHWRIQDQLKKSEAQLRKLGEDLGSDIDKISGNEEDLSINVVSEEEASDYRVSSHNEKQNNALQSVKRREGCSDLREPKQGDRVISLDVRTPIKSKRASRWNISAQPVIEKKTEEVVSINGQPSCVSVEDKPERRNIDDLNSSPHKSKSSASKLVLPQTGMAARAVVEDNDDEEIEIDLDDDLLENETNSTRVETLTLPPRPPILKTNYAMYEGDDEKIDVDGIDDDDDDEMV